jgi:hypothetical protein
MCPQLRHGFLRLFSRRSGSARGQGWGYGRWVTENEASGLSSFGTSVEVGIGIGIGIGRQPPVLTLNRPRGPVTDDTSESPLSRSRSCAPLLQPTTSTSLVGWLSGRDRQVGELEGAHIHSFGPL